MFICVHCDSSLAAQPPDSYRCPKCSTLFERNRYGFLMMLEEHVEIESTTEEYAEEQHHCGHAVFDLFLRPQLDKNSNPRILDVGCGVGTSTTALVNSGFDAYGIDLPSLAPFWTKAKNEPDRFINSSATRLPFADNLFDFTIHLVLLNI